MKKSICVLLLSAAMMFLLPWGPRASAAATANIVDMHGTKTYLGTAAAWAKTWDEDSFTDVTNRDVSCGGSLTVKAGTMKSVSADGSLTVSGGSMTDINGGSTVTITGGTIRGNVTADGNITFGGKFTVSGSVNSYQTVAFHSGVVAVGGSVTGQDVTFTSGVNARVVGTVKGYSTIKLAYCTLSAKSLDSDNWGTLELAGYKNTLPKLVHMGAVVLDAGNKVVCRQKLEADSLTLNKGSEFVSYSDLVLNTLNGPGTLCVNPGSLTVNYGMADLPTLIFNSPVGNGSVAFLSSGCFLSSSDVFIHGFDITASDSGSVTRYRLSFDGSSGLAFNTHRVELASGKSTQIHASVSPALSQYASGTRIIWELHGDSSGFSISPSGQTCTVSRSNSASGTGQAVVIAYLVDRNGTPLIGYRADSCTVTSASESGGYHLDTSSVSVLTGNRYGILANGGEGVKPSASSSNPAVASLNAGVETKDKNGNTAWLYTVTGGKAGTATITIGGQKTIVTVNSGILMDTLNYTMSPGAVYCVGVTCYGVTQNDMSVTSTNPCVSVSFYRKAPNGMVLYRITGVRNGTATIVYQVKNGQSVKTAVTVKTGARAGGRSARLVALKQ
jgi:hypothetical protein